MLLFVIEILSFFLREREPKSLDQASKLADQFKEARYTDIVNLPFKANDRSRSRSPSPSFRRFNYRTPQSYKGSCFICGNINHVARFCPNGVKSTNIKVAAVQSNDRSRSRSPTKRVRFQEKKVKERNQVMIRNWMEIRYVEPVLFVLIQ